MGRGPPGVFGKQRVPCVQAGLLSRCLETPAWIRAQGSHHALPQSGGEPASTALGGGRSSLSAAVSRKSIAHIRGPHPERQKFWAALCLPRRAAEREGCLQTEVGPLDSGGRRLGVPVARLGYVRNLDVLWWILAINVFFYHSSADENCSESNFNNVSPHYHYSWGLPYLYGIWTIITTLKLLLSCMVRIPICLYRCPRQLIS